MNNMKRKIAWTISAIALMVMCCPVIAFAADGAEEYVPNMYASFWALIPPVVAIALALITTGSIQFAVYRYCDWWRILF